MQTNENGTIKINEIKCNHHPVQNLIYFCETCENDKPGCRKCVTSVHREHKLIDIDDINEDLKLKIISNYNKNFKN